MFVHKKVTSSTLEKLTQKRHGQTCCPPHKKINIKFVKYKNKLDREAPNRPCQTSPARNTNYESGSNVNTWAAKRAAICIPPGNWSCLAPAPARHHQDTQCCEQCYQLGTLPPTVRRCYQIGGSLLPPPFPCRTVVPVLRLPIYFPAW